jgi:serine/threonine-protein kinase
MEWLRGGESFSADQQASYLANEAEGNQRRLRILLPLMLFSQLLLTVQFGLVGQARLAFEASELLFRDAMTSVYFVSTLGCAALTLLLFRGGESIQKELPLWASLAYLLHVTTIVGIDQLIHPKITVFSGACMGIALLVSLSPRRILITYGVGTLAYLNAILVMQSDGEVRSGLIRVGLMTAGFCCGLALFLVGARRRDYRQTLTIEEQREQLEELNSTLEKRVAEQVESLTRRAAEVERLNNQLRDQVKDRSRALTIALRRLADGQVAEDDLEGRLVGDRFSIGPKLASGGMGAVYEGIDTSTGEQVAVKVIRSKGRMPVTLLERFLREAETAATVKHPAIVRMLHVDIAEDGTFYQVQELVNGETLRDALRRHGRFTVGAGAQVLAVLADALAAAHAMGVVHRDVKPANVMLTREAPGLKLLDFGISKIADETGDEDATLFAVEGTESFESSSQPSTDRHVTRVGAVMGTPHFMSPEQQTDASQVTDRSDVWALGVVASLLFCGRLPVPDEADPFTGVEALGAAGAVLNACLEPRAEARPTAADVAASMRALAERSDPRELHQVVSWDALRFDTTDAGETLLS